MNKATAKPTASPSADDSANASPAGSSASAASAATSTPATAAPGGQPTAAAPAPAAAARPGLRARLAESPVAKFLSRSLSRHATAAAPDPLATAQARIAELEDGLRKKSVALKKERTAHAATTAQLSALCGPLALKPAELAGKTDAQIRTHVATALGRAAREKLAEIGQPLAEVPAASQSDGEDLESLRAQLRETTDPVAAGKLTARIRDAKKAAAAKAKPKPQA